MRIQPCVLLALLLAWSHCVSAEALYSVTDLGTLGGGGFGLGINNAGQVVGSSATSTGAEHAFLYSNGQMQDVGTLGGHVSQGTGIGDMGQVRGTAATSDMLRMLFSTAT